MEEKGRTQQSSMMANKFFKGVGFHIGREHPEM